MITDSYLISNACSDNLRLPEMKHHTGGAQPRRVDWRHRGRAAHLARGLFDEPRQVPGVDGADSRRGEGAVPRAEDQTRNPQVRADLPRLAHRPSRAQVQGEDLARFGGEVRALDPRGRAGREQRGDHRRGVAREGGGAPEAARGEDAGRRGGGREGQGERQEARQVARRGTRAAQRAQGVQPRRGRVGQKGEEGEEGEGQEREEGQEEVIRDDVLFLSGTAFSAGERIHETRVVTRGVDWFPSTRHADAVARVRVVRTRDLGRRGFNAHVTLCQSPRRKFRLPLCSPLPRRRFD
mmetsp:Transcript_12456/g.52191  ORF Transcript_12456/g.52191 Transcript_12456/m.52191 type:complete len:295 (+) Transcript_12456:1272-2156(+)